MALDAELGFGDGFFNSKIKAYVRNMYVYGCMKKEEFLDSNNIFQDTRNRIERMGWIGLADGEEKTGRRWTVNTSAQRGGEIKTGIQRLDIETGDSRLLSRNPLHICYRYYGSKGGDALFFLMVILGAALTREKNDAGFESPGREKVQYQPGCFLRGMTEEDVLALAVPGQQSALTDEEQQAQSRKGKNKQAQNERRRINEKLSRDFKLTGLMRFRNLGGSNLLELSDHTLRNLLDSLTAGPQNPSAGLDTAFLSAVSFFAQTGPFSSIGGIILDRLAPEERKKAARHFRAAKQKVGV